MNFAHVVGEHNFSSLWEALSHMLVNLVPFSLAVIGVLVIAMLLRRPLPQEIVAKIRRK